MSSSVVLKKRWPDRCFLLGMVMFFNIANLDTKSVVAILGQDCLFVFDHFRFPTLFSLSHPYLKISGPFSNFQVLSISGDVIPSSRFRTCGTRWIIGENRSKWLAPAPTTSSIRCHQHFSLFLNSVFIWLSHQSNLPAWLTSALFFQIPTRFDLGFEVIHGRLSSGPITSWIGQLHTQSLLLRCRSKNSCYALWSSLRRVFWLCCCLGPSKKAMELIQTEVDTGEWEVRCSMNSKPLIRPRLCFTSSTTNILNLYEY